MCAISAALLFVLLIGGTAFILHRISQLEDALVALAREMKEIRDARA